MNEMDRALAEVEQRTAALKDTAEQLTDLRDEQTAAILAALTAGASKAACARAAGLSPMGLRLRLQAAEHATSG